MDFEVSKNTRRQIDTFENRGMRELWLENEDIRMNVLCRLPTEDLLALRRVSKEWNQLICDRTFVRLQLKMAEPISGFFLQQVFQWCDEDYERISYIPVGSECVALNHSALNFFPESVVILASCTGLICCRSRLPCSDPVIYVCNPLKKEWTCLQLPNPGQRRNFSLAFDPFQDPIDVSTKFKIVAVSQNETDNGVCLFQFDLYSSETGQWRRSNEICHCNHDLIENKGIYVGGVLYWPTKTDEILMFNLEAELSWLVTGPLPATEFATTRFFCMGESKGRLKYVLMSEYGLQLWMLEDEFTYQWVLRHSLSLDELEQENPQYLYNLAAKFKLEDTDVTVSCLDTLAFKDGILLMRVWSNMYSFSFETRKMRKLCSVPDLGEASIFCPIVVPYTMSLVPVC